VTPNEDTVHEMRRVDSHLDRRFQFRDVCDLWPHRQSDRMAAFTLVHLDLHCFSGAADRIPGLAIISARVDVGMGFGRADSACDSQLQDAHFYRYRATAMLVCHHSEGSKAVFTKR
jgi:hypothetical protein